MANLCLTTRCQRRCRYCFGAPPEWHGRTADMSQGTFEAALLALDRSGIREARLLGGEPTLHPHFVDWLDLALAKGLRALVFSNGLIDETLALRIRGYGRDRVTTLVNAADPGEGTAEERQHMERTLGILGHTALLGRTVAEPDTPLAFLLDLIDVHGLERTIRLGLAHPSLDGRNAWLAPRSYALAGERIADFIETAAERRIRVEFDCGVVPCMFPPGFTESDHCDRERLGKACGPIPDILPDGAAVACFPLASLSQRAPSDYEDLEAVRRWLRSVLEPFRDLGIRPECRGCDWKRRGQCQGGCVAVALRRLQVAGTSERAPEQRAQPVVAELAGVVQAWSARGPSPRRAEQRFVIPYVDQPLPFWEGIADELGSHVAEVYFPLPGGWFPSGRPPQPELHLGEFLDHSPFPLAALVNPIVLPRPADALSADVLESLKRLDGDHGLKGVTVSNIELASLIREELPHLQVTASVLMDIERPNQVVHITRRFDGIVPSGRILRDLDALRALRRAFPGRVRLLVNEGCLPGCPLRVQHFFEMASGPSHPQSLCASLLAERPWLRLTGAWVLPQHLSRYDGLFDEVKLAGRVTLSNPERYRAVLGAYVRREPLTPDAIGGGPASPLASIAISDEFVDRTQRCRLQCDTCSYCEGYLRRQAPPSGG
jgi:hypothetical protein